MNQQELQAILEHGFKYGHQYNPKFPDLKNLTSDDLKKLPAGHRLVEQMVQSVQWSDYALEEIAYSVHGRMLNADGDPGPATLKLVDVPRCNCPDFGPDAGIRIDMAEEEAEEGTGTGSWLHSCYPGFDGIHAIKMALEKDRMQSSWLDNLDYLLGEITKAENAVGQHPIWIFDLSKPANMKIEWGPISGNVIGYNTVPSSFSCSRTITGKIDTTWSPSGLSGLKKQGRLGLHEWFLHGNGYGHTPGPWIGNPSITDGEISWKGDILEAKLVKNFGGPIAVKIPDWGTGQWL